MAKGEAKKERGPHPATVQRKAAASAGAKGAKPPHPATVQRKAAAPADAKGAKGAKPPHPATVQRKAAASAGAKGAKGAKPPHPATVQRKPAQPTGLAEKPPHSATLQRKAATPGSARQERGPHPATMARTKSASVQASSVSAGNGGSASMAAGSSLYYSANYPALNAIVKTSIQAATKTRNGASFDTATSLQAARASLSRSGGVLELRTVRPLQGGMAAESASADFELDQRGGRAVQCKLHAQALDALEPVAVHLRDARGAWTRFTVEQYKEMVGA